MRLPVSQLSALLTETIKQARDAACALQKQGVATLSLEDFTVEVELVPDGGWNAIRREEIDMPGEQVTVESRPETKTISVHGESVTESSEPERATRRTEVRVSGTTSSTKKDGPVTRTSTRSGGSQTTTKSGKSESEQEGGQDNRGGDVVNQDYTVEAT